MTDVVAVAKHAGVAVLGDGEVLRITDFFDIEGNDCEWVDAVSAVAGPTKEGKWIAIDLDGYGAVQMQ